MKAQITEASNAKTVIIPSMGLYHSFLDEQMDWEVESIANGNIEVEQELYDFIYSLDLRKYNDLLVTEYNQFLIDMINNQYDINLTISNSYYESLNGNNVGDKFIATIDNVDCLPSINVLADKVGLLEANFINQLDKVTKDWLTSRDGFISFHDNDITPLLTTNYANWEDIYISVLLQVLTDNLDDMDDSTNSAYDIEQLFIEYCHCNGLIINTLYDSLSSDDSNKLTAITDKVID